MPQFDKITFLTQIFWLILIFFGLYLTILQILLPKLAAVLKSRKKKLSLGSHVVYYRDKEGSLVSRLRNAYIRTFVEKNKNNLNSKLLSSVTWLFSCLSQSTKHKLENSQFKYLRISSNSLVKYYTSFKMLKSVTVAKASNKKQLSKASKKKQLSKFDI